MSTKRLGSMCRGSSVLERVRRKSLTTGSTPLKQMRRKTRLDPLLANRRPSFCPTVLL